MEEVASKSDWFGRNSPKSRDAANTSDVMANGAGADDVSIDVLDRNLPQVPFNKYDMYYNMTGDKILHIFNHYKFEKTPYFEYSRPSQRNYTEKDVKSLTETFEALGFKTKVHHDLKHIEILKKMSEVCKKDHRSTSCVAVAIMSHGDGGGVFASDRPYLLSDVTKILQDSAGLVGKPKLLFVQVKADLIGIMTDISAERKNELTKFLVKYRLNYRLLATLRSYTFCKFVKKIPSCSSSDRNPCRACRGENMDDGRRVQTDGKQSIVLPTHADTLIMYASVEDYVAYRDANGSWMMQSLCEVLNKYHGTFDLLQMITLVHQDVAYKSTYTMDPKKNLKKLMPETKFTLTKLVKF